MPTNTPSVVDQALQDTKELIEKGVTASDIANNTYSTSSALIAPQNLKPMLTDLTMRETSFYQRVNKTKGMGKAAEFNLLSGLYASTEDASPRELFYADGGVPVERKSAYSNIVSPYRDMGLKGSVTGRAIRQEAGFLDLEAQEVKNTMQRMVQALDWLCFWSDDTTTNVAGLTGFKGLDKLITTNVVDAASGPITKALIDKAARKIAYQGGSGMTTHIFTSYGVGIDLDNIYNTKEQININLGDTSNLTLGNHVKIARTVVGDLEIVPNFFINPGNPYPQGNSASSGPQGLNVSTVFILAMPFIDYEELLPMSKIDLAPVADKKDFMVLNSGTVTLRAEPFCAKITNVLESVF